MNALFWFLVIALGITLIVCVVGMEKKSLGIVLIGSVLAIALAGAALFAHVWPTSNTEYRIVYVKDADVVVIDDNDGSTKRYNLDKIAHSDVTYDVGSHIAIVTDCLGNPVFITPAEQIVPAKTTEPKPSE